MNQKKAFIYFYLVVYVIAMLIFGISIIDQGFAYMNTGGFVLATAMAYLKIKQLMQLRSGS